jgi:hypothetical protein
MSPRFHQRSGLTAALAAAAMLAAAAPAQSMPSDLRTPDARDAGTPAYGGSYRPVVPKSGEDHVALEAALAQEAYYESHRATAPVTGHDVRTIDARDAADAPGGAVTRVTAPATPAPASSSDFEWGDAAIGAGSAIGLVLVLAGGVAVISRRRTPATQ